MNGLYYETYQSVMTVHSFAIAATQFAVPKIQMLQNW